jgi:hypothetical protein
MNLLSDLGTGLSELSSTDGVSFREDPLAGWRGVDETGVGACVLEMIAGHPGAPHVLNQCDHTIFDEIRPFCSKCSRPLSRGWSFREHMLELENPRLRASKTPG